MKSTDAGTSPVKRRRVGAAEEVGFEDVLGALLGALEMDGTNEIEGGLEGVSVGCSVYHEIKESVRLTSMENRARYCEH